MTSLALTGGASRDQPIGLGDLFGLSIDGAERYRATLDPPGLLGGSSTTSE